MGDYHDVAESLGVLYRRRRLMAGLMTAGLAMGLWIPQVTGLKYEAVATLSMRIPSENAQTTSDRVKDHGFLTVVIADLGLQTTPERLSRRISVAEVRDVMQVSVRAMESAEALALVQRLIQHLTAAHVPLTAEAKRPFLAQREQLLILIEEEQRHMEMVSKALDRMGKERRNDRAFLPILQGSALKHALDIASLYGQIEFLDERLETFGSDLIGIVVEPISPWSVKLHRFLAALALSVIIAIPLTFLAESFERGTRVH